MISKIIIIRVFIFILRVLLRLNQPVCNSEHAMNRQNSI